MTAPVVGLTGGIAAGKSTVAAMFRALGVPVLDADEVARELVEPGTEGLAEVVRAFGPDVLDAEGRLDRKALATRVFSDEGARRTLESILHPRIARRSAERLAELTALPVPYVLYDAALLVERGLHRSLPATVVVEADETTRLERLMRRDGLDELAARRRMRAQIDEETRRAAATHVIRNDGPLERTAEQVRAVHADLLWRLGRQ
ncbi:MAG: dephospho-CoA kinase [Myxococcota bacterium]|nr:dephospho-CoA kinase [Myxococcota bacterium]MDW8362433.1 dephospho-CoA kinase [Myxococcales bacterium]